MEASKTNFTCIAIYSSKMGFDDLFVQKEEIQEFAKNNNLKIETYIDAAKFDGFSVDQVCESLKKVKQSTVMVWRLDCLPKALSRMEDFVQLIFKLNEADISFISVKDELDTDSTAVEMMKSLLHGWKNFKKNRKITNARASSIKTKSKNIKFKTGRPKLRDDKLIHSLRASGLSIRAIAAKIGLSTMAVQRSLKTSQNTTTTKNSPLDSGLVL